MFLTLLIAFFSLIGLLILHEFGHFVLAKLFNVKVEEFGIGYPPRLVGKKFGETIYSINLLPFGAFVKMPGEIEIIKDERSFSLQPVSKKALIALGGVLSFWIISAMIFSIVFNLGTPVAIGDEENSHLVDSKVQVLKIAPNSPAEIAGIKVGDTIRKFSIFNSQFSIEKVKDLQKLTEEHKGKEVILTIERGKEILEVKLIPRVLPPEGEGPMGVVLVRIGIKKYPWYRAPWQGIKLTFDLTLTIIGGYFEALKNVFKGLPSGVQLRGPVGIFQMMKEASELGFSYFLNFLGLISIYIALFNLLPIPAVDGGKLLFLGIEAMRKKPISPKIEQKITAICFSLLIALAIWVTIKDLARIF